VLGGHFSCSTPMPSAHRRRALRPEAFYLNAHREIYRTALMLHGPGQATDLTAMARLGWRTTGQLEKVVRQSKRLVGAGGAHASAPPRSTRWPAWLHGQIRFGGSWIARAMKVIRLALIRPSRWTRLLEEPSSRSSRSARKNHR